MEEIGIDVDHEDCERGIGVLLAETDNGCIFCLCRVTFSIQSRINMGIIGSIPVMVMLAPFVASKFPKVTVKSSVLTGTVPGGVIPLATPANTRRMKARRE